METYIVAASCAYLIGTFIGYLTNEGEEGRIEHGLIAAAIAMIATSMISN